jgi:copper oxidase (laccase) domain-containing protein
VRLLTTNTEEIGSVHAGWMTVFGIVACNRCEVTGAAIDAVSQKTITAWGQYRFR